MCKFDKPVVDVKFSPRHLGMKLATGWQDGIVRIYEAMDVMNLAQWSLMEDFDVTGKGKEESGCHVSWNPSCFDPPSLAVGTSDGTLKVRTLSGKLFRKMIGAHPNIFRLYSIWRIYGNGKSWIFVIPTKSTMTLYMTSVGLPILVVRITFLPQRRKVRSHPFPILLLC